MCHGLSLVSSMPGTAGPFAYAATGTGREWQ